MSVQVVPDQRIRLLAAQEAEVMEWTAKRAGIYGVFAHSAFSVMDAMVHDLDRDFVLFAGAWATVRAHSGQALLAAMRQHRTQMTLGLRQVLEGTTLAAYLMANPKPSDSPIDDEQGNMLDPKVLMTKRVYPWFKASFPNENDRIKELKDQINLMTGHANLLVTAAVFDYYQDVENGVTADFFDRPVEEFVWANFYEVGEAISLAIQVVLDANSTHNAFRLRPGILDDLVSLEDVHRRAAIQFNETFTGQG